MSKADTDYLVKLTKLIPPPKLPSKKWIAGRRNKWIHDKLAIDLPSDFFAFAECYGAGSFGISEFSDIVEVFCPLDKRFVRDVTEMIQICAEHKRVEGEQYIPYNLHPAKPGLFPWGVGGNRRAFFWLTKGESKRWTTIVQTPEHEFNPFNMPLTRFLFELFNGKIDGFGGTWDAAWFRDNQHAVAFRPKR
jgi:hypothetical protein